MSQPHLLVRDFHHSFGAPIGDTTRPNIDIPRAKLRIELIGEEFAELVDAVYGETAGFLLRQALQTAHQHDDHRRDTVAAADALADLVYVIYGTAIEAGIHLPAVLDEVHASNMSKLDENGQPVLREDGKILKSSRYTPPNITAALGLTTADA